MQSNMMITAEEVDTALTVQLTMLHKPISHLRRQKAEARVTAKLLANTLKITPERLKAYAREVGQNVAAFELCFSSGMYQTAVQHGMEGGTRAGISGLLALFTHGQLVGGLYPFEPFCQYMRRVLSKQNPPRASRS